MQYDVLMRGFGSSAKTARLFKRDFHGSGALLVSIWIGIFVVLDFGKMDPMQFAQFMEMFKVSLLNQSGNREGGGGNKRLGASKEFVRVEKFLGDQKKFKEWSGDVKVAIKGANLGIWNNIVGVEKVTGKYKAGDVERWAVDSGHPDLFKQAGAELYDQLCLMTGGEAKEIVKGAEQENGFVSWKRLLERYDVKTPARFLRDLLGVVQPGAAKDFREVAGKVETFHKV